MKRVGTIVLVLAVCMLVAAPSFAEDKKVRWNLAMTWNSTLTPFVNAPMKVAQLVSDLTGGNFVIKIDGAEKHKAPLEILDMVKGGQFEMGHSASYYWKGKDAVTTIFTTVPFGMNADEQNAWLYYGGGMQLMQKSYDKFGVYAFPGGNTGVQMGGWFRKEIKSLDDLKGLKMRIPGVAGEVFSKLGVNVTNIAPGELYTSLDRGVIDALEWVGPGMDIKMGFHKIAPYYYTGWHEPATDLQFLVNKKAFDALPPEYQAALKVAMQVAATDMHYENFAMSADAWVTMKTEFPNIKVLTFPEPVLQAMKKATDEVLGDYAAKDPFFKEVLDSQQAFMKKAREWTKISEQYYLQESQKVVK
jgi:TRAP-type mannitol/chloroaromatic compound transport system substrate-binding protein